MKHTTSFPNDTPLLVAILRKLNLCGNIHDKINERAIGRANHIFWYGEKKGRSVAIFNKSYYNSRARNLADEIRFITNL